MEPLLPVAAEGLRRVAHLAALDLLNQPPPSIARGALTGETARRCLRAVTAAVHEPPARGLGRPVGVHAAAAPVASGVGPRAAGETSASVSSKARAASSVASRRARRRPEASRQRTSQPPRLKLTLTRTSIPLSRRPDGRTGWTYCHVTTARPPPDGSNRHDQGMKKAPACGGFSLCAREDSNFHGPFGPQGPQPWTGRVDASRGVQIVQIAKVPWTQWTRWTHRMLSRVLSRRAPSTVCRRSPTKGVSDSWRLVGPETLMRGCAPTG
jgi:hypothetical protein